MEEFFKHLIPGIPEERWAIDRAHRALRARRAERSVARDVIIRFHHYCTKDAIVKYCIDNVLQYQDTKLGMYQDLGPATLQRRKEWRLAAELFRSHEIRYTWGHPFKLVAFKAGRTQTLTPGAHPVPFFRGLNADVPPDPAKPLETKADTHRTRMAGDRGHIGRYDLRETLMDMHLIRYGEPSLL
ncbi:Hypothetical predicted protein [Pelobates cultripes]|uniref:Uncharacterized protein n=1 Tax=Pelobates cultripes TaxID=61616 RepID=A0AAD1VYR3_PELCU|nr:Hypothetical predicted protein [Pelobates cultripes]